MVTSWLLLIRIKIELMQDDVHLWVTVLSGEAVSAPPHELSAKRSRGIGLASEMKEVGHLLDGLRDRRMDFPVCIPALMGQRVRIPVVHRDVEIRSCETPRRVFHGVVHVWND